jgi:hypothetical protein
MMKKIKVIVTADMELPDNWEIAEHADNITVLKIEEKYYDFDLMCFSTDMNEKNIMILI